MTLFRFQESGGKNNSHGVLFLMLCVRTCSATTYDAFYTSAVTLSIRVIFHCWCRGFAGTSRLRAFVPCLCKMFRSALGGAFMRMF